MPGLFESIFDIFYLLLVISYGIKLLFIDNKSAKMLGLMGVLLGAGDSFHLIPRVMAHMTENGMQVYEGILSWGKLITSITMTIFYLIYYFYYRRETNRTVKVLDATIYLLVIARIILTLMPQNKWGSAAGSLTWDIIRNIPFIIMGLLLILLSLKESLLFKRFALLIFISFACYVPVVLFADTFSLVGMLMIPKTASYFLIVYEGYRTYKRRFVIADIKIEAFIALIFGLAAGVFFREFTKAFEFTSYSMLSILHVHTLVLGFLFGLIIYLLLKENNFSNLQKLQIPLILWRFGLLLTVAMMMLKGIYQITGDGAPLFNAYAFSGIAGLGHIMLSMGIVWLSSYGIKAPRTNLYYNTKR